METLRRLNDDWSLATEIHKLEARLWRKVQRDRIRVVMISSAERGEGKSTTVAHLATALALHEDRRILAVDLDFRDPKLNTHFGIENTCGFGAVLRGARALPDGIQKTSLPNLDLILPAEGGEDPALLMKTVELRTIFDTLRRQYDLILMDVPALIPVADASSLIPFADAVILMAMAGRTTKPLLARAREICLGMDARILGLIIGNLNESIPSYGKYGYYHGYQRKEPAARQASETRPRG
jgi:capsular exopolysaccharide synthesis family protein